MFLLETSTDVPVWLQVVLALLGVGGGGVGAFKVGLSIFNKVKNKWVTEGAKAGLAIGMEEVLANRQVIGELYTQLKAVVKAVDVKENAVQHLISNMSPGEIERLRGLKNSLGATMSLSNLPDIELAAIPFKDIVNDKLLKEDAINDELLKTLVSSARADASRNEVVNKIVGTAGAVAGEGINIGAKIFTGGTIDLKDILKAASGVGSTIAGAKPGPK